MMESDEKLEEISGANRWPRTRRVHESTRGQVLGEAESPAAPNWLKFGFTPNVGDGNREPDVPCWLQASPRRLTHATNRDGFNEKKRFS